MQSEKRHNGPSRTGRDWHYGDCYGCGEDNVRGLGLEIPFDENTGEVRFNYHPGSFLVGPPGYVHGGALATVLDEAQGVLCFHVGHMVMTEKLMMTYHKATPLEKAFRVRCWISAVRKRRLYTRATIHNMQDEHLVSSRGVWYLLPDRTVQRLLYTDQKGAREFDRLKSILEANRRRARLIRKRLRI